MLPGGLARTVAGHDAPAPPDSPAGWCKDAWVLGADTDTYSSLWLDPSREQARILVTGELSSRAAEQLFWVGRYGERAEGLARLLRVVIEATLQGTAVFGEDEEACLAILLAGLARIGTSPPAPPDPAGRESWLRRLAADAEQPGTMSHSLHAMISAAAAVRDRWSGDSWRVLRAMGEGWERLAGDGGYGLWPLQERLDELLVHLAAFAGLNQESLTRQLGWAVLDAGRRIERAVLLVDVLTATLAEHHPPGVAYPLYEAILQAEESLITYRRHYRTTPRLDAVLELLLLEPTNPRSLRYPGPAPGRTAGGAAPRGRSRRPAPGTGPRVGPGRPHGLDRPGLRRADPGEPAAVSGDRAPSPPGGLQRHVLPLLHVHVGRAPAGVLDRGAIGMTYDLAHTTHYRYHGEVSLSYNLSRLRPRDLATQRCERFHLRVTPTPADLAVRSDSFGNTVHYFEIHHAHAALEVRATSRVTLRPAAPVATASWEQVRDALARPRDPDTIAARRFCLPSPLVPLGPELARYASPSFPAGRDLGEAAADFCSRMHHDVEFIPGVTEVGTPVHQVLEQRCGVCQDFAHLAVACLRSLGLAARYVSGYLETDPPPGREKLVGADASHAWISVYGGEGNWIDLDPTNDVRPSTRHLAIGWGRDFSDVSPLQGVHYGGGGHTLSVAVDVRPIA